MSISFLKQSYRWLYVIRKLAGKELKNPKPIPLIEKFRCWSKGFFSSSYVLYGFDTKDPDEYLSDYSENVKAIDLNFQADEILDDKIKFSTIISEFIGTPNDIAVIKNGKVYFLNRNPMSIDLILNYLNEDDLILKPIHSASGSGVIRISQSGNNILYGSDELSRIEFAGKIERLNDYMISVYVKQAKYSSNIFPGSVNTIRILTMIDPENNEPFIAAAAHRFGTMNSAPVDNCNAGGITASIDIETGVLGSGILTYFDGTTLPVMDSHPDTGQMIKGVTIPDWISIKRAILETASKLSFLKYIGWDIVVRDNDFIVLEGNNGPDIKLHQVHYPLLKDPRVKAFYKYYNVI